MSDQTNAVEGDFYTINHFVNIFLNFLFFQLIYLVVMSSFTIIYFLPNPSPICCEMICVQSGLGFTVSWHG